MNIYFKKLKIKIVVIIIAIITIIIITIIITIMIIFISKKLKWVPGQHTVRLKATKPRRITRISKTWIPNIGFRV